MNKIRLSKREEKKEYTPRPVLFRDCISSITISPNTDPSIVEALKGIKPGKVKVK